jgi:hypothetical protein
MPDENDVDEKNDERIRRQIQATKELTGMFLDTLVQVVALEFALQDAKRLDLKEVHKHALRLEGLESVRKMRSICGVPSELLKQMLGAYQGPVQ